MEDGRAVGVKAKSKDGEFEVRSKAVIIATGGFGDNPELIKERFVWVCEFLDEKPAFMSFLLLTLPICGAVLLLVLRKKKPESAVAMLPMVILGLAGVSLPIYYVFFGNVGLRYPRRQEAYVFLSLAFAFYFVCFLIRELTDAMDKAAGFRRDLCISGFTLCLVFLASNLMHMTVWENVADWLKPKTLSDGAYNSLQCAEAVKQLPEGVVIYAHDYYQMPQISLLADRQFVPFMSVDHPTGEEAYFVTGTEETPEGYDSYLSWLSEYYDCELVFQYPKKGNDPAAETGNIYHLTQKKD